MKAPIIFPDILLPAEEGPVSTWAVIACDQFTSDEAYWRQVEETVGTNPSTLRMILPEIYLGRPDQTDREADIRQTMERYLQEGVFRTLPECGIYVRRRLPDGTIRRGLVVAVDLEAYDFDPAARSPIRASEETIPERLPPRAAIRDGAAVESPHVLVLYDDPENGIVNELESARPTLETVYDTELILGGGGVTGYAVPGSSAIAKRIVDHLEHLDTIDTYGFVMATGDGNHSLAAAKTVWTRRKAAGASDDDPYRYCLVELVNVYDEGLPFHPIHRLVEVDETRLLERFLQKSDARFHGFQRRDLMEHIDREHLGPREIGFIGPKQAGVLALPDDAGLAVAVADAAIERSDPGKVDYVHGLEEVVAAANAIDGVALILPEFDRGSLFSTVALKGALPRKAFSLGEARDKRYYLECRRLR
ncbi:MAG: DUF1015 domain-containing protein [Alkalispirochaeta sp.]